MEAAFHLAEGRDGEGSSYSPPQPTGVPPHFLHTLLAPDLEGRGVGFAEIRVRIGAGSLFYQMLKFGRGGELSN